jgi:hypothetical protein
MYLLLRESKKNILWFLEIPSVDVVPLSQNLSEFEELIELKLIAFHKIRK